MNGRKRPRAINRTPIIWDGDDGDDVTAIFPQLGTHPWDATTLPHDGPGVWYSAPPEGVTWTFTGRQSRSVMTINPPRPDDPAPGPAAVSVVSYLRAKVNILRGREQLDRISDDTLHRRSLGMLSGRHTASEIVSESAELLNPRQEWAPDGGWNHGWASDLPWIDGDAS